MQLQLDSIFSLSFLRLAAVRPLIVPFWTDRAFAFRALVLWAFEAPSVSVRYAAACFTSWFGTVCLDVAILLATFAHFVARAVFVADAFGRRTRRVCRQFWTDIRARKGRAHRMCCTLGMDTCRSSGNAQIQVVRIITGNFARCVACSVRFRSAVSANHRACDPMMIRFRFLLGFFSSKACLDLCCQALT
jgi:hypothetical protein